MIDLSLLPAPNVIETLDFETLFQQRKARLLELTAAEDRPALARTLSLESEPLVKLLQENAYREMVLRARINDAAKASMLAYAQGCDLDQLVANFNIHRFMLSAGDLSLVPPQLPTFESDEDLRSRGQQAFEGLSVAGPRGAYIYHAQSADSLVSDVSAISPAPCEVTITVLSREGSGHASPELLAKVQKVLNDDDIRPLGDRVTVQSAEIVPFSVLATLFFYPGPEAEPLRAAAEKSLKAYLGKQRRIGRDIRRSALFAALHVEGVQRVELEEPAVDVVLNAYQASHCSAYTLLSGGVDE